MITELDFKTSETGGQPPVVAVVVGHYNNLVLHFGTIVNSW